MSSITSNFSTFSTKFTANEIHQLMDEYLANACKVKYNITEEIRDNITNTFTIEFFMFSSIIQYDTWSKLPKNKINITFQEGKNCETNLVEFKDCSTTKSLFCRENISALKSFITEKEK